MKSRRTPGKWLLDVADSRRLRRPAEAAAGVAPRSALEQQLQEQCRALRSLRHLPSRHRQVGPRLGRESGLSTHAFDLKSPSTSQTPKTEPSPRSTTPSRSTSVSTKPLRNGTSRPKVCFSIRNDVTIGAVFPGGAAIKSRTCGPATCIVKASAAFDLVRFARQARGIPRCRMSPNGVNPLVVDHSPRRTGAVFASHPRLDLFVGSMSPHKVGEFGCTICHEGQGNATAFKWVVAHAERSAASKHEWSND